MTIKRVKISSIVETQFPLYVREEYPLISEFISEYYKSLDNNGSTYDILQNIDQYVKLDEITNLIESTVLTSDLDIISNEISVSSTEGFPENNGIIKVDEEIIYYKSKNSTTFLECVRGFSGVTSYKKSNNPEELVFSESSSSDHLENSIVENLSILFLKQFFVKLKTQVIPGFENRELYKDTNKKVNEKNFIIHSNDFYSTKGTDTSFEILFKAIYGDIATVIRPRDFLIAPSNANYKITKDIVVEPIIGNPIQLYNRTLFQKQYQGLTETFATIAHVEEIIRNEKKYYVLSLDYDYDKDISVRGSIFGEFSVHAKTKALDYIKKESNSLTVDSTIGFPDSGELAVKSSKGNELIISYTSKNNNQFLGCNITEDINIAEDVCLNVYAYSFVNDEEIRVRILGVIRDMDYISENRYHEKGETIRFSTLGKKYDDFRHNDWILDTPNKYSVSKFEKFGLDQLLIFTYDSTFINPLDEVYIQFFDSDEQKIKEDVFSVIQISQDRRSFYVSNQYNIQNVYYVRKKVRLYNEIINNVQNVYGDEQNNVYVASQGIPDYVDPNIEKRNFSIDIFGTLQGQEESKIGVSTILNNSSISIKLENNHDFKNGDAVTYVQTPATYTLPNGSSINLNIFSGLNQKEVYYIQNIKDDELKLFKNRSDIYFSRYNPISFNRIYSPRNLKEILYSDLDKINLLASNYYFQSSQFVILFDDTKNIEVWYYVYGENQWQKIDTEIQILLYPKNYLTESSVVKEIKNINLIKKISVPEAANTLEETKPGPTGILMNGVEILNYKANDFLYYGNIEKVNVVSSGEDYDVINLPIIEVSVEESTTEAAKVYPEVTGELKKIDILDGGFDFIEEPKIKILGGNGDGAEATANLISFTHEVEFIPSVSFVNLSTNTISFSTYHKFRNYEEIIYETNGNTNIGGISTSSTYIVTVQDDYSIKLHKTRTDALSGITIDLTSYGSGTQKIVAKQKKSKIGSITVINQGQNYRNNYVSIPSSGINTYKNTIIANNHGYLNGDIVNYDCIGTNPIGVTSSKYYVNVINENEFKLCPVGLGSTAKDTYFKTNQFLNFVDSGIGTHIFRHEPISVEITGLTGISSYSKQLYQANVKPIFNGTITNVYVENGGIGYGSSEIINYKKQPDFNIKSGKNAQVQANILNGTIKEVYVINGGSDYYSVPDLIISGTGTGCILSPELENGRIKKIIVINGGYGYEQNKTEIKVVTYGKNASFDVKIKSWQINYAHRILNSNNLNSSDDGVLYFNEPNKIKYCHIYCPNKLRQKLYSKFLDENGNTVVRSDYENSTSTIKYHSPIIGWAYDGNPIYGPYGYDNPNIIGKVRKMRSGYEQNVSSGRPPEKINDRFVFPIGSFIEDYMYVGNGDLDESNGRYCITPEYPNGTYAYFTTLSLDSDSIPEFPYFIGKYYKSKTIENNFKSNFSQNSFDYFSEKLLRNTYFYSIDSKNSSYEFLNNPNKEVNQNSKITSVQHSSLDSVSILSPGDNYSVGDPINFDSFDSGGSDASGIVASIKGKEVLDIKNVNYSIPDVELVRISNSNTVLGLASSPHSLNNFDFISVVANSDSSLSDKINLYAEIAVNSNSLVLSSQIETAIQTGIVTEFPVIGILDESYIIENDYYKIENETVKILKIIPDESKITVLRESTGTAHTAGTKLTELTRKFYFDHVNEYITENRNREIYFDPIKVVGFGTTSGSLVEVYYAGIGTTSLLISPCNLYLKDHKLSTNVGLNYYPNGGNPIQVYDGFNTFDLDEINPVYAIKISDDIIGISTSKVGIGTSSYPFLYFVGYGTNKNHSFRANYNSSKAKIQKNISTVSTASTHGLNIGDTVNLRVISGISTTIKIKYNDQNRRLISGQRQFSVIDTSNSTFTISNHGYYNGQPLIYNSVSPSIGLTNDSIYYATIIDEDRLKLSETYYDCFVSGKTINIATSSSGSLQTINSSLSAIIGQKIIFDLSDSSLSFNDGLKQTSAFSFDLYKDENYNEKYYYSRSGNLEVTKIGNIGIDTSARLELNTTAFTPIKLYYKLNPVIDGSLPDTKNEIYTDTEVKRNNTINVFSSEYSGKHTITGIGMGSTNFNYQLEYLPEIQEYNTYNSEITYYTNSKTAFGGIDGVKLLSNGRRYRKLPGITSITSNYGESAILFPVSSSIGRIRSTEINDIGYDYSIDPTVRPTVNLPTIFKIDPFSSIDTIKCTYIGKDYNYSPDLLVVDPVTNAVVSDMILEFDHIDGKVSIVKNSSGFNKTEPKIIPINNSNGIGVKSLSYDPLLKRVTAYLQEEYLDEDSFPISINDKILVENTSIIETTSDYIGYNSSEYEYNYFTVTGIQTSVGVYDAYIYYDVTNFINDEKEFGLYDTSNTKGSIVPEKNIAKFKTTTKINSYLVGETVECNGSFGIIDNWNEETSYAKVQTIDIFNLNSLLTGKTSGSIGEIIEMISFESNYNIDYYSIRNKGWQNTNGFLSANNQRLSDNDYYQYFSYSVKSRIPFDEWSEVVDASTHTVGFKKFSDLSIESDVVGASGISTSQDQGSYFGTSNLNTVIDLECTYDFDLGFESNVFDLNYREVSDEICFNSATLQDYSLSIGNRVLIIDDISGQFNTTKRSTLVTAIDI